MKYTDYMQLYYNILLLLCNQESEYSVNTLSKELSQPPATIRGVLYAFLSDSETLPELAFYTPTINGKNWKAFKTSEKDEFQNGKYDDAILQAFPSGESVAVSLEEYEKMKDVLFSSNKDKKEKVTDYLVVDGKHAENRQLVHKTWNNYELFSSKNADMEKYLDEEGAEYYVFGVFEDKDTGLFYAMARPVKEDACIHFIPFEELKKSPRNEKRFLTETYRKKAETIKAFLWAPEKIPWDFETILCRMQINNSKEKILRDLSGFSYSVIPEKKDMIVIDLEIIDTSAFLSWIIGYGSSITVISPDSIRQAVISEYKAILEKYKPKNS